MLMVLHKRFLCVFFCLHILPQLFDTCGAPGVAPKMFKKWKKKYG